MQIIFRLILVLLFIGVPCGTHAAKKDLTDNVTYSNPQLSFGAADANDTELYNILDGTAPTNGPLNIGGTGDSWLEMSNNTVLVDDITGKYGVRFSNGVLQQIINGTPSSIGSGGSEPTIQAADPVTGDATGWYIATGTTKLFYNVTGDANYDFGTYTKNTYTVGISDDFSTNTTSNYIAIRANQGMIVTGGHGEAEGITSSDANYTYHVTSLGTPNHTVELTVYRAGAGGASGLVFGCDGNTTSSTGYTILPSRASTTSIDLSSFDTPVGGPSYITGWITTEIWNDTTSHRIKLEFATPNIHLWVDWNDDLDFDDAGEDEGSKSDGTYTTGTHIGTYFYENGASNVIVDDLNAYAN